MKTLITAALALGLTSAVALAADMPVKAPRPAPPPPPFSWTGCYLGGNVGAAWAQGEVRHNPSGATWDRNSDGVFIGGGQVGCNYQVNSFVIGAEWDYDWAGHNSNNGQVNIGGIPYRATLDNKWVSTLAARLGFANGQWLFYGKVGVGWVGAGNVTVTNLNNGNFFTGGGGSRSGIMGGGGIEYAFTNNWTIKAEYDYIGLSNRDFVSPIALGGIAVGDRFTVRRNVQEFKVGINYLFNRGSGF